MERHADHDVYRRISVWPGRLLRDQSRNLLATIRSLTVSDAIAPDDQMFTPTFGQHYFYVGRSNILAISNILNARLNYSGGDEPIKTILDFGCGHGRVTRWLRAAFPDAVISVTDHLPSGVEWCVQQFDCRAVQREVTAGAYDLIWLGSVFTHLPSEIAERLLHELVAGLRPNGVLAFTSQGRYSVAMSEGYDWERDEQQYFHYNLDRARYEAVVSGYLETGYGYIDYPGQQQYGVCIARPNWYAQRVLSSNDLMQIFFQERASDNHQDVQAFMLASLTDRTPAPLWPF
jgi:SAM-dependent methyltransferase